MFSIDQLYPHDLPIISHCLLVIPYWLHSFDILMFDGGPQTYHTKIVHIKLIINKLVHQHECALWMLLTCYFQKYLLTCYFQKYLLTIANIPYTNLFMFVPKNVHVFLGKLLLPGLCSSLGASPLDCSYRGGRPGDPAPVKHRNLPQKIGILLDAF